MARLRVPPTISRLVKPAPGRAPIQSATSRTTMRFAAATRPAFLKPARVSAVSSKPTTGACIGALKDAILVPQQMTDSAQKRKTQIPRPMAATKWAKTRWYTTMRINSKRGNAENTMAVDDELETEVASHANYTFITDDDSGLLNDFSFDETLEPAQQLFLPGKFARFKRLMAARFRGQIVAECPSYGGADSFVLSRKRPRVTVPRVTVWWSKIPCRSDTTLAYGVINVKNTIFTTAKRDCTKTFNCFGFAIKSPATTSRNPKSLSALDINLLLPEISNVKVSEASSGISVDIAPSLVTAVNIVPVPAHKATRFRHSIERRIYDRKAPPKDVKISLDQHNWKPRKKNIAFPRRPVPVGFDNMFTSISSQTITLKPNVLLRFKAVQEYEDQRRQEAIRTGNDNLPLGQLDYGNAEYRLALKLKGLVTVDDIGTFVDSRRLDIPASTYDGGPLLRFGAFEDKRGRIFRSACISAKAAAYKEPMSWVNAPKSISALDTWTRLMFGRMQPADLEHELSGG